jgi:hypothetical protein
MMHWYDWMTLLILVVVTIIQTVRGSKAGGMGLPLFEAAGVVAAAVAATAFSRPLAGSIHVSEGVVLLVLFLVFAVLAFILGRWLFTVTSLSFESLDGLFSFLFGLVMAWTIAHMVLRVVIASQGGNGEIAANLANSPVAREVFSFRTWNALMRLLFKARLAPEINPDVG